LASLACAGLIAAAVSGLSAAAASAAGALTGAGSTLVAPIEAEWANAFQDKTGNAVTYQAVGSGTGITDISQRLVDFGASDAPLTPAQESACNSCVELPWALSATGVGIHVGNLKTLNLTGAVLARIYLGQITNWDDPAIKALNRTTHLPNLKITPIFRSDGSGDTYAFTDYLSRIDSAFAGKVGNATSVSFPTGVGEKGNSGMISGLEGTNGAIAYVGVSFLLQDYPRVAAIKNAAGKFEVPNLSNIENAARSVTHAAPNIAYHIVNPPKSAKIAYPISTFTYVIVPKSAPQGSLIKQFVSYALGAGQQFGPRLDFAAIPKAVLAASKKTLSEIG
jgi:phosphate transport system substrate-binding protein